MPGERGIACRIQLRLLAAVLLLRCQESMRRNRTSLQSLVRVRAPVRSPTRFVVYWFASPRFLCRSPLVRLTAVCSFAVWSSVQLCALVVCGGDFASSGRHAQLLRAAMRVAVWSGSDARLPAASPKPQWSPQHSRDTDRDANTTERTHSYRRYEAESQTETTGTAERTCCDPADAASESKSWRRRVADAKGRRARHLNVIGRSPV